MISLKEIGQICGVAESTVSKALKDHPGIKLSTRERIQKVAREHNYQPNAMVQCIQSGKSKSIGVAYNHFNDAFAGAILDSIYKALYKHGYDLLVIPWDIMVQDRVDIFTRFSRRRVDGLLVFPMAEMSKPEHVSQLRKFHNPVVMIDQTWPETEFDYVGSDNRDGAREATQYLIDQGHSKIAAITYTSVSSGAERHEGFLDAMNTNGLAIDERHTVDIEDITASSYHLAKGLLEDENRPDAVLCFNDNVAMDVIAAATDLDIRVPEQLSLVGFGNLPLATCARPAITTVAQNPARIGAKAVDLLLDRLSGKKGQPHRETIPNELIVRKSTTCNPKINGGTTPCPAVATSFLR
jgi:DNA-binding LacI/PurR family transcriptional regulator